MMTTGLAEVEATVTLELHLPAETAAIVSRVKIGETVFERTGTEPPIVITEQDVSDHLQLERESAELRKPKTGTSQCAPTKGGKRGEGVE